MSRSRRPSPGSSVERGGQRARARVEALGQVGGVELGDGLQRGERVGLGEGQAQLGAEAVAAHRGRVGGGGQRARVVVDVEAQAGRVARHPPDAGGVVDERRVVEHAQHAGLEVLERALDGGQRPVQAQRHRVDRHVAAVEVVVERAGPHVGQGARVGVALGAGAHEVEGAVADADARGAEALVGGDLAAQARRGGVDVALDDDVELAPRAPEQQVAHGPADEVHALARREGAQQARAARVGAQHVEGV